MPGSEPRPMSLLGIRFSSPPEDLLLLSLGCTARQRRFLVHGTPSVSVDVWFGITVFGFRRISAKCLLIELDPVVGDDETRKLLRERHADRLGFLAPHPHVPLFVIARHLTEVAIEVIDL